MKPPEPAAAAGLGRIQRWMQACILAEGPVEQAVATPAASAEFPAGQAASLIRPSRTLEPLERLDIYRGMYELRLLEALRVDYPGLIHFLGDDMFAELARIYISACPSRSYTLNRLGDRLPEFVARVEGLPKPRFVEALARLELAETLVFDEEESPVVSAGDVAGLDPARSERLHLRPIRALRAIELSYPAHLYLDAMRGGEPVPSLRPRATRLVVYRRNHAVFHLSLSAPAYVLFQALARGETLGEAMATGLRAGRAPKKHVFEWFRRWFSEGLFQSAEPG